MRAWVVSLGMVLSTVAFAKGRSAESKKALDIMAELGGAEPGEFPHQIKMNDGGTGASCGGTIYNKEWIITAAHCIIYDGQQLTTKENGYVIAGLADTSKATENDKYRFKNIIYHEQWNSKKIGLGYDIALVHLARPLPLEKGKIQPLRVEDPDFEPDYWGKALIMGFGKTGKHGTSEYLLSAEVPIHEPSKAERLSFDPYNGLDNPGGTILLKQHLSVAGDHSGFTVGQGDSGGPAVCADENNRPVLCGIASYKQCEKEKVCHRASYFVRLAPFIDWIKKKTHGAKQEKEFLVDKPFLPTRIKNKDAPGYLVRVTGPKTTCAGTLISPRKVITTLSCAKANAELADGEEDNVKVVSTNNVFHFKSGRAYSKGGLWAHPEFESNLSPKIKQILNGTITKNDMIMFMLQEDVEDYEPLELPPDNYKITEPAVEYIMNENVRSIEARTYLPVSKETCQRKANIIDPNFKVDRQHLCMTQDYSSEANCDRELGGPLVCEGKYLCGYKMFNACGISGFPEMFVSMLKGGMSGMIKGLKKA